MWGYQVQRICKRVLDPNSNLMNIWKPLRWGKPWQGQSMMRNEWPEHKRYVGICYDIWFWSKNILGMTTPLTPCHSPSWARRALVLDKRSCTSVLTTWPLKWWWCSWRMLKLFGCYPLGFFPKSRLLIPKGRVPESGLRPLKQTHLKYLPGCYVAIYVQILDDWKSK